MHCSQTRLVRTNTKIPFDFKHKINFVALNVDGREIPAKPLLTPNMSKVGTFQLIKQGNLRVARGTVSTLTSTRRMAYLQLVFSKALT
jgi:hypothetical protein